MKKLIMVVLFLFGFVLIAFAGNPLQYTLFQAIDADGNPVSGGLIYTYETGTTTPKVAYTDQLLTVPASNPIVLDSKGEAEFYLSGFYKIDLKTSSGSQVDGFPVDNISDIESIITPIVEELLSPINNISDLRSISFTPFDGQKVSVLGYYLEGDKGGGDLYWDESSTDSDNGGTIIKVTSITTGRWLRLYESDIYAKWFGAKVDGVTDDTASILAIEAFAPIRVNLDGGTCLTTLTIDQVSKFYFNGNLELTDESTLKQSQVFSDYEIGRPRTKSPVLNWNGKNVLWVGTSIPAFVDSGGDAYPLLFGDALSCDVTNNAWAGSHATYDVDGDAFAIGTIKSLSMTEDDRVAGEALYGASSAYNDNFDPITKASQQTCDYRIGEIFKTEAITAVILDHNHNDRGGLFGELNPAGVAVTGVSIGATTDIVVADASSMSVGDSVSVEMTGIPYLNYAAARIQAISTNTITLNIDSSAYLGTFSTGTVYVLDKLTIAGGWHFLISFIRNAAIINGTDIPKIILCGAPSEYTGDSNDQYIWPIAEQLKLIAEKWGETFFDIGFLYDVKLSDHLTYFPDSVHPSSIYARRALANYWVSWASGGISDTSMTDILPGVPEPYINQREALYSDFDQAFTTRDRLLFLGSLVYSDVFDNLTGWTLAGSTIPAIVSNPWTTGNAVYCTSASADQSMMGRLDTYGENPKIAFTMYLPEVSGLTTESTTRTVQICKLWGAGVNYSLQLLISTGGVSLRLQYFTQSGGDLISLPDANFLFLKETPYDIELSVGKGDSTHLGGVTVSIDGTTYISGSTDTEGQITNGLVDLGIISTNTGQTLEIYFDDFSSYLQNFSDYSARFTGSWVNTAGDTVTVVNGIITTVAP